MSNPKMLVSSTRHVYTYAYLYEGARFSLEQAEASEEGQVYNCMAALVFSSFCVEAYLNHIASKLLPYWDDDFKRSLKVEHKLKLVCHFLGIPIDFSCSPFQSFTTIFKFRNMMAHAETDVLSNQGTQRVSVTERMRLPQTWWERQCTIENVKRLLTDTEAMIGKIHQVAGGGECPFAQTTKAVTWVGNPPEESGNVGSG